MAALLIFALTSGTMRDSSFGDSEKGYVTDAHVLESPGINGYVAGSMYAKLEGSNWVWSLLLSYFLFLGPFFLVKFPCPYHTVRVEQECQNCLDEALVFALLRGD